MFQWERRGLEEEEEDYLRHSEQQLYRLNITSEKYTKRDPPLYFPNFLY
jgi:hypothetical protein